MIQPLAETDRVIVTRSHRFAGEVGTVKYVCAYLTHSVLVKLDCHPELLAFYTGGHHGAEVVVESGSTRARAG